MRNTRLFKGIREEDVEGMLSCLDTRVKEYPKGACIFRQGEETGRLALVLEGTVQIQWDDYWGNRSIVNRISAGELFGEAYAAPESGAFQGDAVAVEDVTVAFFDLRKTLTVCASACRFHTLVVQNLFYAVSEKNRQLMQKLRHIAGRTTREKLLSYLTEEARRQGSAAFTVPFNRQQLADYLGVDRSAMSNELCKMRDEGLLRFERSYFQLLDRHTHG